MKRVTKDMVLSWTGSNNTINWLLDTLTEIANYEYTAEELREDVLQYNQQ